MQIRRRSGPRSISHQLHRRGGGRGRGRAAWRVVIGHGRGGCGRQQQPNNYLHWVGRIPPTLPHTAAMAHPPGQLPAGQALRPRKVAPRKVVAHQGFGVRGATGRAAGTHLQAWAPGCRREQQTTSSQTRNAYPWSSELVTSQSTERSSQRSTHRAAPPPITAAPSDRPPPPTDTRTCSRPAITGLTQGWLPPPVPRCQHTPFLSPSYM